MDTGSEWEPSDSKRELVISGFFSFSTQKSKHFSGEEKSDLLRGIEASLKEEKDRAVIAANLIKYSNSHGFRTSNVPNDGLCFYYAVIDQLNVRLSLGLTGLGLPCSDSQANSALLLIAKNLRKLVSEHIIKNFNLYSNRIPDYVKGRRKSGESDKKMATRLANDLLATDPIPFADEFEMEILAKVLNIQIFSLLNTGITGCINRHKDTVANIFIGNEQMRHFQSLKDLPGDSAAKKRKKLMNSFEELEKEDTTKYAPGTVAIPIKELLINPSGTEMKESKYEMLPKGLPDHFTLEDKIKNLSLGGPTVSVSMTSMLNLSSHVVLYIDDEPYLKAYKREVIELAGETKLNTIKFVKLVVGMKTLPELVAVTKEFAEVLSYQNLESLSRISRLLKSIISRMFTTIKELNEEGDPENASPQQPQTDLVHHQHYHFNFTQHHHHEEEEEDDDDDEGKTSTHGHQSLHSRH